MAFIASAIVTGGLNYLASRQASNAQVQQEQQALQFQQQQTAKLNPFINVGTGATYSLGQLYGIGSNGQPTGAGQPGGIGTPDFSSFFNSPDYQFAQQQGTLGLQRYEDAAGLRLSGGGVKDAIQFNQGLATQQYGNYFNRLMSLSQLGASAANAGVQGGNGIANTFGQIGQSQASGIVGGTNALTGGINSGITNSLLYNAINRSSYAAPTAPTPSQVFGGAGPGFAVPTF